MTTAIGAPDRVGDVPHRRAAGLLAQQYALTGPRAIAALSMGGLGTPGYVARHRSPYIAAASFSGIGPRRSEGRCSAVNCRCGAVVSFAG
jgi:S-formylglutathione hydrolase FrmB